MTTQLSGQLPLLYKGLALFTPGGDLIYCLDPSKQGHWHAQLCMALQQLLGLTAPPLFLTPCYTATVDRWLDSYTQELRVSAEAYPQVWRYRAILSHLFAVKPEQWQLLSDPIDSCDPPLLLSYRDQFPQLWQSHNLVVQLEQWSGYSSKTTINANPGPRQAATQPSQPPAAMPSSTVEMPQGYVLRLFVSNRNPHITQVLENLHQVLDQVINAPYTLKIVDVTKHPDQAEMAQVTATPTLMRMWPLPVKRVVGDLDQIDRLLPLLDDPFLEESS